MLNRKEKIVIASAKPKDAKDVAILLYEGFLSKMQTILRGDEEILLPFLMQYYSRILTNEYHNLIVSKNKSNIVGLLVLTGPTIPTINSLPTLSSLRPVLMKLDLKRFFRFLIGFTILDHVPNIRDSIYISTITVKKEYRGKGIGKILIDVADKIGQKRGLSKTCLYVAEDNYRAISLYQKKGYKIRHVERNRLLYSLFGIYGFFYMIKKQN